MTWRLPFARGSRAAPRRDNHPSPLPVRIQLCRRRPPLSRELTQPGIPPPKCSANTPTRLAPPGPNHRRTSPQPPTHRMSLPWAWPPPRRAPLFLPPMGSRRTMVRESSPPTLVARSSSGTSRSNSVPQAAALFQLSLHTRRLGTRLPNRLCTSLVSAEAASSPSSLPGARRCTRRSIQINTRPPSMRSRQHSSSSPPPVRARR